ncbi:hypothetical protein CHH28_13495 [Bacterioplanes sanyensis]|uniref:GGDEF domain-containing protein n=1 Tax=Bacterioplanes sanyensis TaxID=1249553 RepID=A0A222FN26_9GAMM|nr:EAL domain-containing protein [Bacterioplanes sanyensis]ASP39623.1 hypothetical protein CHH28_13495 [Bacterioplanes sanyensis]
MRPSDSATKRLLFLQRLLQQLPDMVWMKDTQGVYLACNAQFERFFGACEAQILGRTDFDFVDAALANFFLQHDQKAMRADHPLVNEEKITLSDGTEVLLETTKTAVHDDQGELLGVLGIGHNITQRKTNEQIAHKSLARYKAILDTTLDGFWEMDPNGNVVDVNDTFCQLSGFSRQELIGMSVWQLDAMVTMSEVKQRITEIMQSGGQVFESRLSRKDGSTWPVEVSVNNAEPGANRLFAFFRDISARKKAEHDLKQITHFDLLTGLANRSQLEQAINDEIHPLRHDLKHTAVVFIDMDGFKAINEKMGNTIGDQLLVAVGLRLRRVLRGGDTLARMSGDEFAAVLPGFNDQQDCIFTVQRLLAALQQPFHIHDREIQVSASIGVTFHPQQQDVTCEQLIRQADQAMYEAKQAGRNRFHVFNLDHDRQQLQLNAKVDAILNAIQQQQFELYYQPKVNMFSGQVIGFEALIRWNHPQLGLLSPGQFLPDIEQHPVMADLGQWTLTTALDQLAQWQQLALPISVNMAAPHLLKPGFVESLAGYLSEHPLVSPQQLELEVLETGALENIDAAIEVIGRCQRLGIHFSLDDFGTGYSSLNYLKLLPVETLKIDRSFVTDMMNNPRDLSILDGIVRLAQAFDRQVIAEGVETQEQGLFLLLLGCQQAQGFGIARPMPAADVPSWVAQYAANPNWAGIHAMSKRNMPALFALVEHRAWFTQLQQAFHLQQPIPELNPKQCKLGKWLKANDDTLAPEIHKQLTQWHQQAHRVAADIAQLGVLQQRDEPAPLLQELHQLSDKIQSELLRLMSIKK